MNYNELSQRIHAANVAKGFWPPEGRDMGEVFALIHAEASEALEAHRKGLPMDVPAEAWEVWRRVTEGLRDIEDEYLTWFKDRCVAEELADVAIRTLDIAGFLDCKFDDIKHEKENIKNPSFGACILGIHSVISESVGFISVCLDVGFDPSQRFVNIIYVVEEICKHYDIDLDAHIEAKLLYNSTRPFKHGKNY